MKARGAMKHQAVLVVTMAVATTAFACSDDDVGEGGVGADGGGSGSAGAAGGDGSGGTGAAGSGGGTGGASNGGAGGTTIAVVPPAPALPADAPTLSCPTVIEGSLDATDGNQTGRHSRIAPIAACGMTKGYPGNAADPSNPHLFDVYRFANSGSAPVCFSLGLTYGELGVVADAGLDASPDAAISDASIDGGQDAAGADAPVGGAVPPAKYLTAYTTFYPTDLSLGYLGDVGDTLVSPQTAAFTVPAGGTIDVVVYAIDVAPAGTGSYTLTCQAQ